MKDFGRFDGSCFPPSVCLFPGSILKHQEDMFATELHRLKQQPLFSLVDFENLIDGIRSTVAEVGFTLQHIWGNVRYVFVMSAATSHYQLDKKVLFFYSVDIRVPFISITPYISHRYVNPINSWWMNVSFYLQHLWTLMVEESDLLGQLKVCIWTI